MALFNIGKKKTETSTSVESGNKTRNKGRAEKTVVKKSETKIATPKVLGEVKGIASSILIRPHITEKSGILSGKNVYTFEIAPKSNKILVKKAIEEVYKVIPTKVCIAQIKPTRKHLQGRIGLSSGGKKAYVYLKEGDKIEFI